MLALRAGQLEGRDAKPGHRRRRAFVLLDRNQLIRARKPRATDCDGVSTGGAGIPAEIVLDALLFVVESSVAVVVAWADAVYVPATGPRSVRRIVFVSPAGTSPAVHVFVVSLNSAGTEADTNVSLPMFIATVAAVAVAVPTFLSVYLIVTVPPGLIEAAAGLCVNFRSARACSPNRKPVAAVPDVKAIPLISSLVDVFPEGVPVVSLPSAKPAGCVSITR